METAKTNSVPTRSLEDLSWIYHHQNFENIQAGRDLPMGRSRWARVSGFSPITIHPEAPHTLAGKPAPQMGFQRPRYGARQIAAPIVLLAKGAMTLATD
jgi:hypothetical protein